MTDAIAYVSIGVADMTAVERLWVGLLGLEVVARRSGPDAELGKLWNLPAAAFIEQLLLRTPDAATGHLLFVQFAEPAEAIRKGAAPTDLCAKNIDVNCTGMPELVARLAAAGYAFRSAISEYEVGGLPVREVQMPAHDDINIVFIEVLGPGFEVAYSPRGFAALTSFVVIVPDALHEARFYLDLFGFVEIMHHRITGPVIEAVIGLPPGAALEMRLCGTADNLFGRMELIQYEGLLGANRFTRAIPPATGILRCGFRVSSAEHFIARMAELGITLQRQTQVDAIVGNGLFLELLSPAGLHIEVCAEA